MSKYSSATLKNSATNTSIALSICAATTLFTGALLFRHKQNRQSQLRNDGNKVTKSHQLADEDSLFFKFEVPPITTLTWFQGNFQDAKPILAKRMKQIVAKNPWLQGRIMATSYMKGTYHLSYTYTQTNAHEYDKINVDENFNVINPANSPLSREMPIATQNNTLLRSDMYMSDIFLQTGSKEPLFKVSLVPCATKPHEAFALVIQLSHAAGDGATYYKLMHMLCSKDVDDAESNPIVELIPERIQNSKELQIEAMGKAEHGYLTSMGFMCQTILGMILNQLRSPLRYEYNIFDPRSDVMEMEVVKRLQAKDARLPFVSTNDVLTSWLMKQCDGSYGLMAINWRNRLEGHTEMHAGNYENIIFFDEEDYASPGLIREAVKSYKRVVTKDEKLPSSWQMAKSKVFIVTNWSTFAKKNEIEGCVEDLHFPLILDDFIPAHTIRMLILFRAGVDKIGLCYPPDAMADGADARDPFRGLADLFTKKNEGEGGGK